MPEQGRFGFRRRMSNFGLSAFNAQREKKLQEYLNFLLRQVTDLEDEPILHEFLGDCPVNLAGFSPAERTALHILFDGLVADFTPRTTEEAEQTRYAVRDFVRVVGLHNATEYNNTIGKIVEDLGLSYKLRMADGRYAKVKGQNVRIVSKEAGDAQLLLEAQAEEAAKADVPRRASLA